MPGQTARGGKPNIDETRDANHASSGLGSTVEPDIGAVVGSSGQDFSSARTSSLRPQSGPQGLGECIVTRGCHSNRGISIPFTACKRVMVIDNSYLPLSFALPASRR